MRLPRNETSAVVSRILAERMISDLTVEDPAIEEVIDQIYQSGEAKAKEASE